MLSTHGKQHDEQSKEKTREAGTENVQHRPGSFSSVSSAGSVSSVRSLVLCREGIPPMLEDLYRATGVGTIHQAAWVVIRVLMLETGFICGLDVSCNCISDQMQPLVKCGFYKLPYYYLWNDLPGSIRNTQSLNKFKKAIKTFLFAKAF